MTAMRPRLRVPSQPRDQGQIQTEHILQPLNGGGGLVCEHLDQVGPCLVTRGLEGIIVKLFNAVGDLLVDLGSGKGTVDTGGSLGGVAAEKT